MKELLSIEEKKVSTLMVALIITLPFALIMYVLKGDISESLVGILQAEIAGIAGINVIDAIGSYFNGRLEKEEESGL